ncbi:SAM hydrolase/SAM-dependent halogenase family protein [Flavobacterium silvaticum]|uniref:SAM-dependent chlorinase/fluorinase n=1 Tax=Flavobacterium silvaticum TaxID=1852020 RepID=A0A972JH92_9FLAO|nr:SAM-dependent chlorinase/fluorinase [Flavobacterium silvaticum]NMH26878.1 SAM-dependent chlorinase/fluorinase [Flavobacterium silvaticum]
MSIITLTSDYGLRDHFVGALKGKILTEFAEAKIIDISHDIDPFNTVEAAYIVEAAYSSFPKGTVHLIGVDIEAGTDNRHIAMEWNGHFFVCADNGILSLLTDRFVPEKIVSINIHDRLPEGSADLDVFVTVACHIAKGGQLNVIGRETDKIKEVTELRPVVGSDNASIKGYVVYIDHFGNVVTNISRKLFNEVGKGRQYEIVLRESLNRFGLGTIRQIRNRYSDIVTSKNQNYDGEKLALFNEAGNLEIALYRSSRITGGASTLLGLGYRDAITINFL